MRNMFNNLLSWVLITENVFLVCRVVFAFYFDFDYNNLASLIAYFIYPIDKISLTAAIFMTISLAHHRYLVIWHPQRIKRISESAESRRKRTVLYVLPVIVFSAIFNIPKFFCYESVESNGTQRYEIQPTTLKKNYHLRTVQGFGLTMV